MAGGFLTAVEKLNQLIPTKRKKEDNEV